MTTKEKYSLDDLSAEPQSRSGVYAEPLVANASLAGKDSQTQSDLDTALSEAPEGMRFDWPQLWPIERITLGIMEIAFGLFLFAALVAFCRFG